VIIVFYDRRGNYSLDAITRQSGHYLTINIAKHPTEIKMVEKQKKITVLIIITMLHDWNEIWPRDGESVMMKRPKENHELSKSRRCR
jgi:hypothetical protein